MNKTKNISALVFLIFLSIGIMSSYAFTTEESPEILITSIEQSPDARMAKIAIAIPTVSLNLKKHKANIPTITRK